MYLTHSRRHAVTRSVCLSMYDADTKETQMFRVCCTTLSSRRGTIEREIECTRKGGRPNTKWEDNNSSLMGAMGDGVTTGPGPKRLQRTRIDYRYRPF